MDTPMMDFEDRVAVVTGGAGGIGTALSRALLAEGARVVVADLDQRRVEAVVAELREGNAPDAVVGFVGDAADEVGIGQLLDRARETHGPVELYFANAGVPGAGGLDSTEADWELALDVNVMAHVRAARLLVPEWLERGEGWFVSTASAAGLLTQIGSAPYSVSKHAAVAFSEWLAITYGAQGVTVSCLCPMGVATAMLEGGLVSDDDTHQLSARVVAAAGTVLAPDEVARATIDGVREGRFLILPHPEVREFIRRRGTDHDRWLTGMRRLQEGMR